MNQFWRSIVLWLVLGVVFLLLFNTFSRQPKPPPEIVFSDFLNQLDENRIAAVTIQGDIIYVRTTKGERYQTYAPRDAELINILRNRSVKIAAKPSSEMDLWLIVAFFLAVYGATVVLFIVFAYFLWRRLARIQAELRTLE